MATLEERVAALEARTVADSIVPTFLTIDAQGKVSASFSGIVNAGGLNLVQPQLGFGATPSVANRIRWLRASDNSYRTALLSWDHAIANAGPILENTAQLNLLSPDGNGAAILEADADNTGAANRSRLLATADAVQATLLRADGASSFLQIAAGAVAKRALDWGTGTLTWPGGSPDSTGLAVAHGLGVVPRIVLLTSSSAVVCFYSGLTSAQFTATAETNNGTSPAAGTTVGFSWLVIG